MQRMINKAVCGGVLFFASFMSGVASTEYPEDSRIFNVTVTVVTPECTLAAKDYTVTFDPLSNIDIALGNNKTIKPVTLIFSQCKNVNKINARFVKLQAGPELNGNYIPNRKQSSTSPGDVMAEGVGIRLLNGATEIKLGSGNDKGLSVQPDSAGSASLGFNAQVVNMPGEYATPGRIETAVGVEISYD